MGIETDELKGLETLVDQKRKEHEGYTKLLQTAREKVGEGDFDAAIAGLLQAREIAQTEEVDEALRQARYQKGMSEGDRQANQGRWKEALASYEMARENAEDASEVYPKIEQTTLDLCESLVAEANDLRKRGRTTEAEERLREALDLDPSHRVALTMMADLRGRQKAPKGMVYIPGGEFSLASDLSGKKQIVGSFYIDRHEVTNDHYLEFVEAGGYREEQKGLWDPEGWDRIGEFASIDGSPGPAAWSGGTFPEGMGDHPVSGISWYEARAYARWKEGRLPFEWEWEMAACGNGGERRKYPWGDDPPLDVSPSDGTRPVGEDATDESPFGVRDLGANVNEWTVGEKEMAVVKGGTFLFPLERYARCSFRGLPGKIYRCEGTGFRCVREIAMEQQP